MNLKEYLNQENPSRQSKVVLNTLEYKVGTTVKTIGSAPLTSIIIHEYPHYNYVIKGESGRVHTADEHGNANKVSCFYIEDVKQIGLNIDGSNYDEFVASLPKEVHSLLMQLENQCSNGLDYKQLASYLNSFNLLGYTFEYGLDAEPYDFRPMTEREKKEYEQRNLFI